MGGGNSKQLDLFGGHRGWNPSEWTASDDGVRGGLSKSYLNISANYQTAVFTGNLDATTLGGSGFASQRTTWENKSFDLSAYDGILIDIIGADSKTYSINIKNNISTNPLTGAELSTISYEYDFKVPEESQSSALDYKLYIPWENLTATYRGREDITAPPLNLTDIKRLSIMCRSFFDLQEGDFQLALQSISAVSQYEKRDASPRSRL